MFFSVPIKIKMPQERCSRKERFGIAMERDLGYIAHILLDLLSSLLRFLVVVVNIFVGVALVVVFVCASVINVIYIYIYICIYIYIYI